MPKLIIPALTHTMKTGVYIAAEVEDEGRTWRLEYSAHGLHRVYCNGLVTTTGPKHVHRDCWAAAYNYVCTNGGAERQVA